MILDLYHATDDKGAYGIDRDQEFHFGRRGYAGPGIYFAVDKKNAIAHAFNGKPKKVTVLISCRVNLGRCLKARPNQVDQASCLAKGYDSVNITGTDTYTVYDPTRIEILGFKSNRSKHMSLQPSMKALFAVETFMAAIKASPESCLNAPDLGRLYSQHPSLREAMGCKLQAFCIAHTELSLTFHGGVTLSKQDGVPSSSGESSTTASDVESEAPPSDLALEILVAAIKASPDRCLTAGAVGQLFIQQPGLRKAMGSKLKAFCSAHSELKWSFQGVMLSKGSSSVSGLSATPESSTTAIDADGKALAPELASKILLAAIRASPNGFPDAGADMAALYSKHPSLHDTLRKAGGVRAFFADHTELSFIKGKVKISHKSDRTQELTQQLFQISKIGQEQLLRQRQALAEQMHNKQDEEALQQRQALALQIQEQQEEDQSRRQRHEAQLHKCKVSQEALRQRQALEQQIQKKRDEDEARGQRNEARLLQMRLDEERQLRQEKEVARCKQALAQQLRMQQKEEQARRQLEDSRARDHEAHRELQQRALSAAARQQEDPCCVVM